MLRILSAIALIVLVSGCHLRPEWGAPGPIGVQRSRAVLNDPFPSDELGPEILGARPRGFDLPEHRAKGLQKYAPQGNFARPNTPFQFAPQPIGPTQFAPTQIAPQRIVPTQFVPTQITPQRIVPTQPYAIQPSPIQPGFPRGFAP